MRYIKKVKIISILIVISCLFLGIGYASISDIELDIDGTAQLNKQTGVVISNIALGSNYSADPELSKINTYYKTMLDSRVVLNNDSSSYITYDVTVTNLDSRIKKFTGVVFDPTLYDNTDITYELTNLEVGDTIAPGESKTFTLKLKYAEQQASYNNTILNSIISFNFKNNTDYEFDTDCVFNGSGNDIQGACANGEHVDYLDTGISLFGDDTYMNDFDISFTVSDIDDSRFRNGKVDTIFSCMYEESPFPGIVFRIENGKWYFQAGNGIAASKKVYFNKDAIQSFRVYRTNGLIYYSINGGEPVYAADTTRLSSHFDSPLTIGVGLDPDGTPKQERFLIGTLSNFSVTITENTIEPITYDDIDNDIAEFIGQPMQVIYDSPTAHQFDGTASTVIDTGLSLLSTANYQKDFVVTLMADSFSTSGQVNQATLVNIKDESNNTWPGIALRTNNSKIELTYRDGTGLNKSAVIPSDFERINIIKKGTNLYYQYDYGEITSLGSFAGFNPVNCFDVPVTFGSNIDANGNYARIIKGTLSNMRIKISN